MIKKFRKFKVIFFDFDGVIKDSVDIKGQIFSSLFDNISKNNMSKISKHHKSNGGMSRYKKIPLYMEWCGINNTETNLNFYLKKFSDLSLKKVAESNWVKCAPEFIEKISKYSKLILVSATPTEEIVQILKNIKIYGFFDEVHGSPNEKSFIIENVIKNNNILPSEALLVGDTIIDYDAAVKNNISFFLRETNLNKKKFENVDIFKFQNFCEQVKINGQKEKNSRNSF